MQANSSGAEFLSTISKFMKRMNFVIACLRPSQNVKSGIFTGSSVVDGKEMYKKAWCTCKVVVLPCEAIANLTFSSPPHLKLPIIYDTLWSVKNRIFSGQIELLLLIAPQTFFRLIGSWDNSRCVRTHEKNSGETVRWLGTINTKHFLCPIRSQRPLEFLEIVWWESVPRGSFTHT